MSLIVTEPFDLELSPGKLVRQLASKAECQQALFQLDMEMESIHAQIARSEADPTSAVPGWRTRAQSALRWKKRTRAAILDFAKRFEPVTPPAAIKRKVLLDVMKDELGADEFERLVGVAKVRHPDVFAGGADD